MNLKTILITPKDLIKYMGLQEYRNFLKETKERINNHDDYENINDKQALWIIGEWE